MYKNISLLLVSALLTLAMGEIMARALYSNPWHERLIEEQVINVKTKYKHNRFGLRDKNYPYRKPSNGKRVLILGDSFTKGVGVENTSAIFPELLEKKIQAEYSRQGKRIDILNGGIAGSLTDQWVDLLNRTKDTFKPDVILIVFFLRDGTTTSSMGSFFGPLRKKVQTRNETSLLYRNIYMYKWLQDRIDRNYLSKQYLIKLNKSYLGNNKQTKEWEKAKKNILQIKRTGENMEAEIGLVVFPVLFELDNNYPFTNICKTIIEFGNNNNIHTHSLLPAFLGEQGPSLWVSPVNQHPNEKGHKIAADSILPFLNNLLLLHEKKAKK